MKIVSNAENCLINGEKPGMYGESFEVVVNSV